MMKDLSCAVDSIITMSKEPAKDLIFIMENINDHLQYLENTPLIAKPFIRKDLAAIMNMEEKELYELLGRIKDSLEKIDIAALWIKDKSKDMEYLYREQSILERIALKKEKDKLKQKEKLMQQEKEKPVQKDKVEKASNREEPLKVSEEKQQVKYVYCPECGHKCKGQNGLKIHVRMMHKERIEEILKTIKIYDR